MPDYMTTSQAAAKWGISRPRVNRLCQEGRVKGAIKPGRDWIIPADAESPAGPPGRPSAKKTETK